jgi:hypothetical protein
MILANLLADHQSILERRRSTHVPKGCQKRLLLGIRLDSEVTTKSSKQITYLLILCLSDDGPGEHCANGP